MICILLQLATGECPSLCFWKICFISIELFFCCCCGLFCVFCFSLWRAVTTMDEMVVKRNEQQKHFTVGGSSLFSLQSFPGCSVGSHYKNTKMCWNLWVPFDLLPSKWSETSDRKYTHCMINMYSHPTFTMLLHCPDITVMADWA